jgi:hypothetical protein
MSPSITVEELHRQLREMVEVLIAPAEGQLAWLVETDFPVDELALQVYDTVPSWLPRLESAGLLTPGAGQQLRELGAARPVTAMSLGPGVKPSPRA